MWGPRVTLSNLESFCGGYDLGNMSHLLGEEPQHHQRELIEKRYDNKHYLHGKYPACQIVRQDQYIDYQFTQANKWGQDGCPGISCFVDTDHLSPENTITVDFVVIFFSFANILNV